MKERRFYRVSGNPYDAPLRDHLLHGYEERRDFFVAVRQLCRLWKDREGEAIDSRHGFLLLRFHDTPGGKPDEAWIPDYLLKPVAVPDAFLEEEQGDDDEMDIHSFFGFD